jgi:hypothetical protein
MTTMWLTLPSLSERLRGPEAWSSSPNAGDAPVSASASAIAGAAAPPNPNSLRCMSCPFRNVTFASDGRSDVAG